MDEKRIDAAVLAVLSTAGGRWRKVAMVISKVANAIGDDLQDGDAGYEQVAQRIEALVGDGRLTAQGNIKNWRFSEVRVPKSHS